MYLVARCFLQWVCFIILTKDYLDHSHEFDNIMLFPRTIILFQRQSYLDQTSVSESVFYVSKNMELSMFIYMTYDSDYDLIQELRLTNKVIYTIFK